MCRPTLALVPLFLVLSVHPAHSQQHYTLGPVQRITLLDIKPGKGSDFWTDLRQNVRPLYDEYKRQGLIQDYSVSLKTTADGPQDWDVALILTFKNWAALDAFATKGDSVSTRYYGSYGKRSDMGAKRSEAATLHSSFLVRSVTLKELAR